MIKELAGVFYSTDGDATKAFVQENCKCGKVFIYGLGRERLMLLAFAMRLMHLEIKVHVVGDVTTPAIQKGDLFITSSGTGYLSTVEALLDIVRKSQARAVFMTAHPDAPLPQLNDLVIKIPAQTMRDSLEKPT